MLTRVVIPFILDRSFIILRDYAEDLKHLYKM